MDLLDACMDGLFYTWVHGDGSKPLDVVLVNDSETLILDAGWWQADWNMGDYLNYAQAGLERDGEYPHWFIPERGLDLYPPDDEWQAGIVRRARERVDMNRVEYVAQLELLRASLSDTLVPAFDEWKKRIDARPVITVADILKRDTELRKVATIHVSGPSGRVDVLILDERGNAATAHGTEWVELFVDEWTNIEARPELDRYALSLLNRRFPAPLSFENPTVVMAEGSVDEIARKTAALT
jgi:hypothetical protein